MPSWDSALRPLTPDEQQQAGTQGLLVEQAEGAAAKAGIQAGDIILAVNGVPTRSVGGSGGTDRSRQGRQDRRPAGAARGDGKLFVPVQIG